ncbi:MAG: hypothetical protein HQK65_13740 [Desulfamplus sp.]|nr:hypothetical protein [Desulfamplus sp.]
MPKKNPDPAVSENKDIEGKDAQGSTSDSIDPALQQKLDNAIIKIKEIATDHLYKAAIEIGDYLLKEFFKNDFDRATSKNPRKETSYNELCKRPDLGIPAGTLSKMIRIANQEKLFEKDSEINKNLEKLNYSHRVSLTRVHETTTKLELAKKCIKNNWSCKKLEENIPKEELEKTPVQIAKSYKTQLTNTITYIEKNDLTFDDSKIKSLSSNDKQKLLLRVTELKNYLENNKEIIVTVSEKCNTILSKL